MANKHEAWRHWDILIKQNNGLQRPSWLLLLLFFFFDDAYYYYYYYYYTGRWWVWAVTFGTARRELGEAAARAYFYHSDDILV